MNAEILTPDQYGELDRFVASHPQSSFTQCSAWRKVKSNWGFEAVVCGMRRAVSSARFRFSSRKFL